VLIVAWAILVFFRCLGPSWIAPGSLLACFRCFGRFWCSSFIDRCLPRCLGRSLLALVWTIVALADSGVFRCLGRSLLACFRCFGRFWCFSLLASPRIAPKLRTRSRADSRSDSVAHRPIEGRQSRHDLRGSVDRPRSGAIAPHSGGPRWPGDGPGGTIFVLAPPMKVPPSSLRSP
jgi:hypothetical protein